MNTHSPQQKMVLWVIWAALFSSVIMYRVFLGGQGGDREGGTMNAFLLTMLIGPTLASAFVRWMLLPKARTPQQTLVLAIIGMAIGESIVFYGLFIFPAFETSFFIISLLAVLQFIPVYANRNKPFQSSFADNRDS